MLRGFEMMIADDKNQDEKIRDILKRYNGVPDMIGVKPFGIHARTPYGDSLLHLASIAGDLEAISFLIASGADVNDPGNSGMTPLHYAVQQDQLHAAELLLKLGADPYYTDEAGETPLDWATDLKHIKLLDLMKSHHPTSR